MITPNGKKIYVNGFNSSGEPVVTPIRTATNKPGTGITVARNPMLPSTVTPDSKTLYIV